VTLALFINVLIIIIIIIITPFGMKKLEWWGYPTVKKN